MSISIHAQNRKVIAQQVLQTVQKFPNSFLQSFIIYGSTAQGNATEESDLDIQILVDFVSSEFTSYLSRVKKAFEEKYGLEIAINIKSVTEFMEALWRKEPLYFFMLTDGQCLLNSVVFSGIKHLLKKESGPSAISLQKAHSAGIQIRTNAIINSSGISFINEINEILSNYRALTVLQNTTVSEWLQSEFQSNSTAVNDALDEEICQRIFALSKTNQLGNKNYEFDLIQALRIMNTIFQETAMHKQ